ncbi:CNF01220-like protein [Naematelia encephala]|uniref:CNF01220-like protein n=1 Tax=Naematelia encephala TaxID=71784 RepID=A0A1Y2BA99_9TREE|nr:CNF01220-like protein [Naematelia encephala]
MSASIDNEKSAYVDNNETVIAVATVFEQGGDVSEDAKNRVLDVINAEDDYSEAQYKKLTRKIDLILMPLLMLTYGLQYSDKVSLSSGVVFGLKTDTHLVGQEYGLLTVWFYLAYCVAQLPMAWAMQRLPLGRTMAVCVFLWGGAVMCLGACNTYAQLSVVRAILGWFEAVVTPGFALIVISWYKRSEATSRQMTYFAMNAMFSIVFGVVIYFIALAQQKHGGLAAWRVINLFLGGLTVLDGILLFIFLGTPEQVWWLSAEQKRAARARVVSNGTGGGEQHPWKKEQVYECFRDRQYWHALFNSVATQTANGALGTFNVLVFQSFGFTALESILYGLPATAIGFLMVIFSSWSVSKYPKTRFPLAIFFLLLAFAVLLFVGLAPASTNKWTKWGVFSFYWASSTPVFLMWSIIPVNTAGRTKKSFLGGSIFVVYCGGAITGSLIFLPSDAPHYLHGLTACAVLYGVCVVNMVFWWKYYVSENQKREAAFIASGMSLEEREYLNKVAGESDLTDRQNPHFRYHC